MRYAVGVERLNHFLNRTDDEVAPPDLLNSQPKRFLAGAQHTVGRLHFHEEHFPAAKNENEIRRAPHLIWREYRSSPCRPDYGTHVYPHVEKKFLRLEQIEERA